MKSSLIGKGIPGTGDPRVPAPHPHPLPPLLTGGCLPIVRATQGSQPLIRILPRPYCLGMFPHSGDASSPPLLTWGDAYEGYQLALLSICNLGLHVLLWSSYL